MASVCDFYLSHAMMASIRILTCHYSFVNPATIPLIRGSKEKIACLLPYLSLPDSIGQSRRECWNSLDQPPNSPNLGGIFKAGGHPQTPGRRYPAPLFWIIRSSRMIKPQSDDDTWAGWWPPSRVECKARLIRLGYHPAGGPLNLNSWIKVLYPDWPDSAPYVKFSPYRCKWPYEEDGKGESDETG